MSDAMSFAEVNDQFVELLPARTVLSLLRAIPVGVGSPGEPGSHGADGSGPVDSAMSTLIGDASLIGTRGHN
jgi:hypothetical protein